MSIKTGGVDLTAEVTGTLPVNKGGTGAATHTANNVLIGEGTSAISSVAPSSSGNILTSDGTNWTSAAASGAAGVLVQEQVHQPTAFFTQTNVTTPYDNTIPQITEGGECLTATITPNHANNHLFFYISLPNAGFGAGTWLTAALHKTGVANAYAAGGWGHDAAEIPISFNFYQLAGDTSEQVWSVRIGSAAGGTSWIKGDNNGGGRIYGGALGASLIIQEFSV
jgi:hypothetical protein